MGLPADLSDVEELKEYRLIVILAVAVTANYKALPRIAGALLHLA
jgi:hypothetical protein